MADRSITRELLKTYGVDRDVACPRCGYNLRGNAGGRCPECGKDVSAYIKRASIGRERGRIIHIADVRERFLALAGPTLLLVLAGGFWAAVHVSNAPVVVDRVVEAGLLIMVVSAMDVWRRLARRTWRRLGLIERALLATGVWGPGLAGAALLVAFLTRA